MTAKVLEYEDRVVVEAPCPQCKKDLKREMGLSVSQVLHRFTLDGELIETKTVSRNGDE